MSQAGYQFRDDPRISTVGISAVFNEHQFRSDEFIFLILTQGIPLVIFISICVPAIRSAFRKAVEQCYTNGAVSTSQNFVLLLPRSCFCQVHWICVTGDRGDHTVFSTLHAEELENFNIIGAQRCKGTAIQLKCLHKIGHHRICD
ncbi:hypothetical protein ASC85_07980 [Pseudomonas sp. Root401]|nr:hypothetical protein ASC85_07980 [Pseudomonas sp. Root401]